MKWPSELVQDPDEIRLLALLPLADNEKELLLKKGRDSVSADVKARLGEKDAEINLISKSENAKTFEEMRNNAESLGYVGTPICARFTIR